MNQMNGSGKKKLPMNYIYGGAALIAIIYIAWKISK
jgi:hypothetical protein